MSGELICVRFLESKDDFSKGSIQEMIYDMAMNFILDGIAEEISQEEYNEICLKKHNKQAKIKIEARNEKEKQENKEPTIKSEVMQFLLMKDRNTATEIIVKELYKTFIFKTTKIDEKNEIWVYKNGIFEPQGRCEIQEQTRKILGEVYTTNLCNIIISKIEADTFIDQDEFFNQQNKYPYKIPVLNGVLNIKTKEISDFTSDIAYFNKIPINYKSEVKTTKFIGFLKEITKEENDIKIIQELFGFSLYKKYKYKKSFMLEGNGNNGKSQLLKILTEHFLGIENTKEISLAQIEQDKFIVGELHNKLVNVSADITTSVVENTGLFKNLTGADTISVARKFKNTISFVNYAKMIFATNELPISKDNSDGFWSRWILLEFPYKYLEQKEINVLSEEERNKVRLAKPNIVDEIVSKEEMTGVLNWALEGFERLEKNKGFSDNSSKDETKKKWLMKANSVLSFVNEYIEEDYDNYIIKNDFKQSYLRYCKEYNLTRMSDKVIKITLENELSAYSSTKYISEQQKYIWSGIKFKEKLSKLSKLSTHSNSIENLQKTPIGVNTMLKLPNLLNENNKIILNLDFLKEELKDVKEFTFDSLELDLKENKNYNFNENQLTKYLEKLGNEGIIAKFGKSEYKVL